MAKTKVLNILVEPEFQERIRRKSKETGIPYSEVVRRALEVWLETDELPKLPHKQYLKKGGRKPIK